jgi:hypothetical protein
MKVTEMKEYCLLGLDVSTKTIGVALFSSTGQLLELTHISPVIKPEPESKLETLIKKADLVRDFLIEKGYENMNIKHILIEEPLLQSNNVNTVGTLLRFNGMITKIAYDLIGVIPTYISTYESRKGAFPELMQPGATSRPVLFGAYPKDVDKKKVIWEKVAAREPQIVWPLDKKGGLKKENFDMSDAYTVTLSYMKAQGIV